MVYITGDVHGNYDITKIKCSKNLFKKGDTLIICGDFGAIWYPEDSEKRYTMEEKMTLDFYKSLPCDVCFIDGNHENFDRLYSYPIVNYCGGKVHKIADNIYHLMRGEIFTIEKQTFLAMGGAASHDIQDGVLEKDDPRIIEWTKDPYKMFRINKLSWWEQEVPSMEEREYCYKNLEKHNFQVDVVLTHEAPASLIPLLYDKWGRRLMDPPHEYAEWLDTLRQFITYKTWCFGHYHVDKRITDKEYVFYNDIKECKDGCLTYVVDSEVWGI